MGIPHKRDWFNVSTIGAPLWILSSFVFRQFVGRNVTSPQVEVLWSAATIIIAFLVWFGGAKTQQRAREAREHEREVMVALDEIKQLLPKPDTTLEDIRRVIEGTARISAASSMRVEIKAIEDDKERTPK
jgi:hypothetical protein